MPQRRGPARRYMRPCSPPAAASTIWWAAWGVEIKKGRPDPAALRRQLDRYAACQGVEALVVLTERAVPLPARLHGKPVRGGGAEPPVGGGAAVNEDVSLIPPYLLDTDGAQPEEGGAHRTYGTLSYNRRRDCWVVRGDPGVTELCKRLFPGSESGRRGEARFPAHRRIVGDLNWLMLRYPLAVRAADRERWEQALTDAREYVVRRETARRMPERVEPSPSVFTGTPDALCRQEGLAFLLRTDRGAAGRRDGPWQNGAGACDAGADGRISGAGGGPAAPASQLGKRDRALRAPPGRKPPVGACDPRPQALCPAPGGYLPDALPAAARLEGGAARMRHPHRDL